MHKSIVYSLKTLWRFAKNRNILNVILKNLHYDLALLEELKFDFLLTIVKVFIYLWGDMLHY
jgi:hypothetical protein